MPTESQELCRVDGTILELQFQIFLFEAVSVICHMCLSLWSPDGFPLFWDLSWFCE